MCQVRLARLIRFIPLGLICKPHFFFLKIRNGLNDHKGPENINSAKVKYKETLYDLHTALTQVAAKMKRFYEELKIR